MVKMQPKEKEKGKERYSLVVISEQMVITELEKAIASIEHFTCQSGDLVLHPSCLGNLENKCKEGREGEREGERERGREREGGGGGWEGEQKEYVK